MEELLSLDFPVITKRVAQKRPEQIIVLKYAGRPPSFPAAKLPHMHPDKVFERWLSRKALQTALKDLKQPTQKELWELGVPPKLGQLPMAALSLSHSQNVGAAILCMGDETNDKVSVGIDVEWKDREFSPGVQRRFLNPAEAELLGEHFVLKAWSIKEAVYKALYGHLFKSSMQAPGISFLAIKLEQNHFSYEGQGQRITGQWWLEEISDLSSSRQLFLASALVSSQ